MKLKIIKKSELKGTSKSTGAVYDIKKLFVSFSDAKEMSLIKSKLLQQGATNEQVDKFFLGKEYKGQMYYSFNLTVRPFTYDNVEEKGMLDAVVEFTFSKGYVNANIAIENYSECVNDYTPPKKGGVQGWTKSNDAPKDDLPF